MKKTMGSILTLVLICLAGWGIAADKLIPAGTTSENLKAAYIGENNTRARYEAFAVKADEEGYAGAASLFRAVAQAEKIHAANHSRVIKALGFAALGDVEKPVVKATKENLAWVVKEENREYNIMYPDYLRKAVKDKNQQAVTSFKDAMEAEHSHLSLFSQAAAELEGCKLKKSFLVCHTCGYTTGNFNIKKCPACAQPRVSFKIYD